MSAVNKNQWVLFSERWVQLFLPLTLFVLPISSSAKSIVFIFSLVSIFLIPTFREDFKNIIRMSCVRFALLFFLLVLCASFWSPASSHQKMFVIEKYSKLAYLPFLIIGFQSPKTRQMGLYAFLGAMCFICILSVIKHHGFLAAYEFSPDYIFRNHIMTGIMVAFATYLAALFCYRSEGYKKLFYIPVIILLSYQLFFINAGRTGYIIYCVLLLTFLMQTCRWKQLSVGVLVCVSVLLLSYLNSTVMQTRVHDSIEQVQGYQHENKDTEIGFRLQFHHFAYDLFKRRPMIGNGTGSFTYYYGQENPVPYWTFLKQKLLEPHSQYWLVASEQGLLGLSILGLFFISLVRQSLNLTEMKPVAIALITIFFIGNLSDSLLFFSGTGYFFLLIMGLCLGERINASHNFTN